MYHMNYSLIQKLCIQDLSIHLVWLKDEEIAQFLLKLAMLTVFLHVAAVTLPTSQKTDPGLVFDNHWLCFKAKVILFGLDSSAEWYLLHCKR